MSEQHEDPATERRAARLGALLSAADVAPRPLAFPTARLAQARRQRTAARWRLAAMLALVLGAPLLHQPLRAWVVARVQDAWHAIAGTGVERAPVAPPAAPAAAPSSVSFTPAAGGFTVRLARRQADGTLAVRFVAGPTARALVLDGAPGEWLVRPDGVELLNTADATSDVLIEVPRQSPSVTVVIGGRALTVTRDTTIQLASR
jgi:hypothetical protein